MNVWCVFEYDWDGEGLLSIWETKGLADEEVLRLQRVSVGRSPSYGVEETEVQTTPNP